MLSAVFGLGGLSAACVGDGVIGSSSEGQVESKQIKASTEGTCNIQGEMTNMTHAQCVENDGSFWPKDSGLVISRK